MGSEGAGERGWVVTSEGGELVARYGPLGGLEANSEPSAGRLVPMRVAYSTLNYKDALVIEGKPGVVRATPLVAGIDAAGVLPDGTRAIVTGAGLGESLHGGLATRSSVPNGAVVELPVEWSLRNAAAVGTAGFTAALSVLALEDHKVNTDVGPVAVTGAGGGVGSIAVSLLAGRGFDVHAITGRPDERGDTLRELGASEVLDRSEFEDQGRPLAKERFGAVVDCVGGRVLANLLAQLRYGGVATACGLAASPSLPASVLPFILRGVTLRGVDSVRVGADVRQRAWRLIFRELDQAVLDSLVSEVPLEGIDQVASAILAGRGTGRTVVTIDPGLEASA